MQTRSSVRAAVIVAASLALAGCNSGGETAGTSTTTSTTPSSTTSTAPPSLASSTTSTSSTTSESLAQKYPQTPAGAEAFVRAFIGEYNAGSRDPQRASQLKRYFEDACESCLGLYDGISSRGKEGKLQKNQAITIRKSRTEFSSDEKFVVIAMDQNESVLVDKSGQPNGTVPPSPGLKQAFRMQWRATAGWKITEIQRYVGDV